MDAYAAYDKIDLFWEWFEAKNEWIRETLLGRSEQDKEALVQSMNNQVLALGMFTWEMGHGNSRPFYLTISPNGSRELLALSREIMKAPPHLPDWELNHAKPAQVWDLRFRIYDEDYNEQDVDASKWKFSLQKQTAASIIVRLEAANISQLDEETSKTATEQLVTGLLGEEQKILHVHKIALHRQLTSGSMPIQQLKEQFEALIK